MVRIERKKEPAKQDPSRWIFGAATGEQKQKPSGGEGDEESAESGDGSKKLAKKGEELKEEMDSLMDEIDNVLEENAEEFVKNYVQRGGE